MIGSFFKKLLTERGLTPEERHSVLDDLFVFGKKNLFPFQVRMAILLILSTIIATAGLLSDFAALVIGAMLVAPMMNPVMASASAAEAFIENKELQIKLSGDSGIMCFTRLP